MRIAIDLQACQSAGSRTRGIGRYSLSLSQAMARNAGGHELWLVINGLFPDTIVPIRESFDGLISRDRIALFQAPLPVAEVDPANAWRLRAAERIREHLVMGIAPDILHVTSLFEGLGDDAVTSVGQLDTTLPTAVTLYDLIPLMRAETYLGNPTVRNWYYRKLQSLKNADLLLAISEHSRQEAISALNLDAERVVNISSAIDHHFMPLTLSFDRVQQINAQYGLRCPFVMYTGGIDFRKNIEGLITAFAALPQAIRTKHQLAIVCSVQDADRSRLLALAKKQGLKEDDLVLTGFVPEEDLVALYNLCELFVFPSLQEGFGLPALEAMACGAAVIGSNTSSIPEVIGRNDALFNPNCIESITESLQHALTNKQFSDSLREHATIQAAKFSWDASSRRAVAAFEDLHDRRTQSSQFQIPVSTPKPKIAFVSPLPPEKSGIAGYSSELLPELASYYDITLIVDQVVVDHPWLTANFPIKDIAWFEANARHFDRILYQFGNSAFHKHMFGLLRRHPGVVVLHDFFLGHVHQFMDWSCYSPGCLVQELYFSHGYASLAMLAEQGEEAAIWAWPCSERIFDNAVGVIVHSRYSFDAARKWYGEQKTSELCCLPHLRFLPEKPNRTEARVALGIAANDFIICSFGILGPAKLNDKLLDAWLASGLSGAANCRLIFVGENQDGEYGQALLRKINQSGFKKRIQITGFASLALYRQYLAAADVAVQLRTLSRGETSGTILDALAMGLPLVINANGSLAEYPDNILRKLPDAFGQEELIEALEDLHIDLALCQRLSEAGRNYVAEHHSPVQVGRSFFGAIEKFEFSSKVKSHKRLLNSLSDIDCSVSPDLNDLRLAAEAISRNFSQPRCKSLLVDISELVEHDAKSGIQRVVRSILMQLIKCPPSGFRVEPVYFDGEHYLFARRYITNLLGITGAPLADEVIDAVSGDVFLGLDLSPPLITLATHELNRLNNNGVYTYFIVYDILLVKHPEWWLPGCGDMFNQWMTTISQVSTGLVCISQTVAEEIQNWLIENRPNRIEPLQIGYFPLGADIKSSAPTHGLPPQAESVLSIIKATPTFLMVGTLEPRKGHTMTLTAFEQLWKDGLNVNLCVVGKQGWLVEEIVERFNSHPQLGKHLFWLNGISDEYLKKIYADSTALLAASYGEGFGLPLIEAAQHSLPIIASDIPVFREVAGEHAFYFDNSKPENLALAIRSWLDLFAQGKVPDSTNIPWLTWKQSTDSLLKVIIDGDWSFTWRP